MQNRIRKKLFYWELFGFFFIFFLGAAWHFLYDWTGIFIISLVAPVNDSVWEHLKLGICPTLIFAFIAYFFIGRYHRRYWAVRALQMYLNPIFLALLFYGYTAVLGDNILFLDILIFAVAVAASQYIGYKLLQRPAVPGRNSWFIPALFIVFLLAAFALLTVCPLPFPIFIE